jgi:uncharacterized membrane protein (DUF485 family)
MTTSDSPSPERQFNTRLGLILFAVYLVFYLGFVLINAFAADLMETSTLAGLNLAIVYGFGLIVAAIVLALIYGVMCRSEPAEKPKDVGGDAAKGGPVE